MKWILYTLVFPLSLFAAKIFRFSQDNVEQFLLKINNSVQKGNKEKAKKVLILVPHCLQNKVCKQSIVEDVRECKKCGKCKIKDLLALSEKYKIKLSAATGGRLAKEIVKKSGADLVLAVACEKELLSGIIEIYPVRVIAIVNKRPFGPCVNTDVDCQEVEAALKEIVLMEVK